MTVDHNKPENRDPDSEARWEPWMSYVLGRGPTEISDYTDEQLAKIKARWTATS